MPLRTALKVRLQAHKRRNSEINVMRALVVRPLLRLPGPAPTVTG